MITRMGIVSRRQDLSHEQFLHHWREVHAPIVCAMTGIRRYQQNRVVDYRQHGIQFAHDEHETLKADGFSELWFDDLYAMQRGITSQADAAQGDLALFTQFCPVLILLKREVIPLPDGHPTHPLLKRITFLRRKTGISAETFQKEWFGPHAEMVKQMPGVVGYNQNIILDRLMDGVSVPYDGYPYDGIVEFWFADLASLEASFASPAYALTAAHGQTFIATMTTFLVETASILDSLPLENTK
ncbi:EthD family reductase [Edwardsiella ictaluri]|uniref:EthD family reductase n=2 Tax=Edwardsiella ictaluri TaxID=67780 RepID=A0ABY8GE88_EDWIC|nr:EthD family reductase [Edwardsiella ictaluri]WFN95642.1 EthD family reductase [Edwardsiella ictaluri]